MKTVTAPKQPVLWQAKKVCVLIGQKKAVSYAIHNARTAERNTKLAERLKGGVL